MNSRPRSAPIRRSAAKPWPAPTPREARAGRPILSDAQWHRLAPRLAPRSDGQRPTRRDIVEAALWALRTGASWGELPERFPHAGACRRQWKSWMRDGRWLDFWQAYVPTLSARDRREWQRAFVHAGDALERARAGSDAAARRAWWLVSARVFFWDGATI